MNTIKKRKQFKESVHVREKERESYQQERERGKEKCERECVGGMQIKQMILIFRILILMVKIHVCHI